MAFLNDTEALCLETEALRLSIETTQSGIAMELLSWNELMADLKRIEQHCTKVVIACAVDVFSL